MNQRICNSREYMYTSGLTARFNRRKVDDDLSAALEEQNWYTATLSPFVGIFSEVYSQIISLA